MTTKVKLSFRAYCRYPSGRHMLDSGGAYGRHWEKPPIPEDADLPMIREWDKGCSATIELAAYLEANYEIREDVHEAFDKWIAEGDAERNELSWFEAAAEFMEQFVREDGQDFKQHLRDNVYNRENDFTQVFIHEVWAPEDSSRDPIYTHDGDEIVVLFIHTGCDVRGGYSAPLFCKSKMDYTIPVDCCAEYYAAEGRRYCRQKFSRPTPLLAHAGLKDPAAPDGIDNLTDEERRELDEHWQSGYSSWPYGQLEKDVERWFEFTRTRDSVCVKLKTGELVKVVAQAPYTGN